MKEARAREQFVAGELAAGRNPAEALRAPSSMPRRSLRQWAEAYRTSRVDLSANAHKALGSHLSAACKLAEIPRYSPHDLRHRYASLKLREGVPVTDLAAQLGHARKSMTLDTYSHVLIDD